jgi:MFS family permease
MCRTPAKAAPPPFPLRTVGLLLLITLADSIVITFLMPMVPYMVRNYGVAEEDVGFSAGSLASAYNLAGLFSGFFWGRISDTYGRRPVLLFGLLSTGATVVWFGLAGPGPHIQ